MQFSIFEDDIRIILDRIVDDVSMNRVLLDNIAKLVVPDFFDLVTF